MKGLMTAEWLKIRSRRLPWILAGCVVGIIGLLYVMLLVAAHSAESEDALASELTASLYVKNIVRFGDMVVYRVVALLAIILAGVITANEYHWRTVVLRASWTGQRVRPLMASLLLVGALASVGLVLGYLATTVSVVLAASARGTFQAGDLGPWLLPDVALGIVRAMPPLFFFVALAVGIATLTRSSAAGIAIPLVVLLIEPIGSAAVLSISGLEPVGPFLLTRNVDALMAANGPILGASDQIPEGLPSAWIAGALLALYAALTVVLATRIVSRREVGD